MIAGLLAPLSPMPDLLREIALVYGVVICSFMAGTHWGLTLYSPLEQGRDGWLAVAVLPALLAWGSAFLPPAAAALALVALFGLLLAIDAQMARRGRHSPDYWRLRKILSAGAVLCYSGLALMA